MTRRRILDFVPDVYAAFLPEWFEQPLADERHATCENCAMCPPPVPDLPLDAYYSPSTKCCTFHPALPNYAVGGLLGDRTAAGAEGRRRIQGKIAARIGVTPSGILPPAKYLLLHRHGKRAFGRAESLVCPYLDRERGLCTVWAHREGECSTWFCKHNHGLDGREFWQQLRDYLVFVHRTLSVWTLRELGFDPDRILAALGRPDDLDARDLDDRPPSDDTYASLWGDWQGREEKLYTEAYALVRALDRSTFARLTGLGGELELTRVERRYAAMTQPTLPDPLRRNPDMRVERRSDGTVVLTSYADGEPTRLREPVFALLGHFDGCRSTADARQAIRTSTGLGVSDSFLVSLYQHRILIGDRRP